MGCLAEKGRTRDLQSRDRRDDDDEARALAEALPPLAARCPSRKSSTHYASARRLPMLWTARAPIGATGSADGAYLLVFLATFPSRFLHGLQ
jgi:hypothetical protein